jgi:hypothetical protein
VPPRRGVYLRQSWSNPVSHASAVLAVCGVVVVSSAGRDIELRPVLEEKKMSSLTAGLWRSGWFSMCTYTPNNKMKTSCDKRPCQHRIAAGPKPFFSGVRSGETGWRGPGQRMNSKPGLEVCDLVWGWSRLGLGDAARHRMTGFLAATVRWR